jgi:hypothetical protein
LNRLKDLSLLRAPYPPKYIGDGEVSETDAKIEGSRAGRPRMHIRFDWQRLSRFEDPRATQNAQAHWMTPLVTCAQVVVNMRAVALLHEIEIGAILFE